MPSAETRLAHRSPTGGWLAALLLAAACLAAAPADAGPPTWQPIHTGFSTLTVFSLAVDPSRPTTVYAGTDYGVYKTADGGATWHETGLIGPTAIWALAVDPATPTTLYAGHSGGIFKTADGGATWLPANTGLIHPYIYSLAVDPGAPGTLYAAAYGGISKTTDGGASWTSILTAWLYNYSVAVAGGTVYVATSGGGVYRSSDGGSSWTPGQENSSYNLVVASPGMAGTLFASGMDAAATFGVFRSVDNGATWQVTGLTRDDVCGLHRTQAGTLFAGTSSMGVYRSTDDGATWQSYSAGLPDAAVCALAAHPQTPTTVIAGTAGSRVYRVRDVAAGPQLFQDVATGRLEPGSFHTMDVTLLPGTSPAAAQVYLALQPPDGSLLFLRGDGSLSPEGLPIATTNPVPEYTGQHFTHAFGGTEPAGTYRWLGALADPGTGAFLSPLTELPFTFYPASGEPRIDLMPNAFAIQPGQTHRLQLELAPGHSPFTADVYLALQLPDGSLLFLQEAGGIGPTMVPFAAGWSGEAGTSQVFSHTFGGSEPAGTYRWLAGFTAPGTTTFIGPIVSAPFSFQP